jgi:hypothetical protein
MKEGEWGMGNGESGVTRREAIEAIGVGAMAAYGVSSPSWERFHRLRPGEQEAIVFFTPAELAMVRVLADMIIPRDEKSGSATDSGAIEYMDFVLNENSDRAKQQWHDGLKWFDDECGRRFQKTFVQSSDAERDQVLDDIAWPARATAERQGQASFFNRVRDLTGSAFFSSRMGVEDLGYIGNVFNPQWRGAPDEALRELGVNYEEWDRKFGGAR